MEKGLWFTKVLFFNAFLSLIVLISIFWFIRFDLEFDIFQGEDLFEWIPLLVILLF